MNLADISKLPQSMQRAVLADQARATAARERTMAQVKAALSPRKGWDAIDAKNDPEFQTPTSLQPLPAKSPPRAVSGAMQAILPQVPGLNMKKAKAPKRSESKEQQEVVRWWRDNCYEWQLDEELLMAIPNQGKRNPANASRMKAEGLQAGVPDLFLAVPRGDCAGLWCEMKAQGGKLSENQRLMLARLTKQGFATVVCFSAQEAQDALRCYLNLPTPSKS